MNRLHRFKFRSIQRSGRSPSTGLMSALAVMILSLGIAAAPSAQHNANSNDSNAKDNAIDAPEVARELAESATQFLTALGPGMAARYHIKDEERRNFHFFPIARRGVPLKDLNEAQCQLGYSLISTALSRTGYQKTLTIMSLGQILRETEEKPYFLRDSDQYYFTIFGDPTPKSTWGFRVEGFHLSFNFTIIQGRWISVTPSFFGAKPAIVEKGPRKGLQVLRHETELGRALAKSFDDEQQKIGLGEVPNFKDTVGGLLTGNLRKIERGKPRGVPASEMTSAQREILMQLVGQYVHRCRRELASQDLARIERAGVEKIHFIWGGSVNPGEPHYYMIQGPTFLIEYENTQHDANHVHCVYRDFDNDFGDALLNHYRNHHHH